MSTSQIATSTAAASARPTLPLWGSWREPNFDGVLDIFPNPAKEYFTLRYRLDMAFRSAEAVIIDVTGKEVYRMSITSSADELLVSEALKPGTYHINILVDNEHYRSTSLIIR